MGLLDVDIAGDCIPGQRAPLSGQIHELQVRPSGWDTAELAFEFEAAVLSEYELGVYVDGALVDRIGSAESRASLAGLADGRHTLNIASNRVGDIWPERHGDPQGSRVYLRWPRSSDLKTTQYLLYWDQGDGGAADSLLATIDAITIDQKINTPSTNGGRVTYYGEYTGRGSINDGIALDVRNDGTYLYETIGGLSGSGEWVQGQSIALPYGAYAEILDDAPDYGSSSVYGIGVGVQNDYLSDELSPGTYKFAVRAAKVSGLESDTILTKTVKIPTVPDAVSNVAAAYAAGDIAVIWTDPQTLDGVRVYTNWDPVIQRFQEHVILDLPLTTISPDVQEWLFDPGATQGTLEYYLRPYIGVHERRDLTLQSFSFPPATTNLGLVLSVPSNLSAVPIGDGGIRVEWDYRFREGDSLDEFRVSIEGTPAAPVFDSASVDPDSGAGFAVAHFVVAYAGPFSGTKYVQVRAETVGNAATEVSAEVSVVPDTEGPEFEGDMRGVGQ